MENYICKCGREFKNSQAFNRHQGYCNVIHPNINVKDLVISFTNGGREYNKTRTITKKIEYNNSPKLCKYCGNVIPWEKRQNNFCNSSCSASYNNHGKTRGTQIKICPICQQEFIQKRKNQVYCSIRCKNTSADAGGIEETKTFKYTCPICNLPIKTSAGVTTHISMVHRDEYLKTPVQVTTKSKIVGVPDETTKLNITLQELDDYRAKHSKCEICGHTMAELNGSGYLKQLAVDHQPGTNHFRGLLCISCNTKLGWLERNKSTIDLYLTRNIQSE